MGTGAAVYGSRPELRVETDADKLQRIGPAAVRAPYRRRMVELVRTGRTPGELAREFDSSSTVSPEVRRPGSNKINTLGGDSGRRCLKCSGK